jgi:hypothetical protein
MHSPSISSLQRAKHKHNLADLTPKGCLVTAEAVKCGTVGVGET